MTCTGFAVEHCPAGAELDRLLYVARIGETFAQQHVGRRPGALSRHVAEVVARAKPATLRELEIELAFEASFRPGGIIVEVARDLGVVTYRDAAGERDVCRKTLANLFAIAKKKMLHDSRMPLSRDDGMP